MHPEYSCPPGRRHQLREFFALSKTEAYGVFQEIHYLPSLAPWEEDDVLAASYALPGESAISQIVLQGYTTYAFVSPSSQEPVCILP